MEHLIDELVYNSPTRSTMTSIEEQAAAHSDNVLILFLRAVSMRITELVAGTYMVRIRIPL